MMIVLSEPPPDFISGEKDNSAGKIEPSFLFRSISMSCTGFTGQTGVKGVPGLFGNNLLRQALAGGLTPGRTRMFPPRPDSSG